MPQHCYVTLLLSKFLGGKLSRVYRSLMKNLHIDSITTYSVRNLDVSIRFSLKSRLSERFHRPEMSQIKAEISLRTNVKLIFHKNVGLQWYQWIPDFYNIRFWANLFNGKKLCGLKSYVIKIRESIDIIAILHFYDKSTSRWYEGWSQL